MESWLYGLLLGVGIASVALTIVLAIAGGITANISSDKCIDFKHGFTDYNDSGSWRIASIVFFGIAPILLITGIVLISICLSVGKS